MGMNVGGGSEDGEVMVDINTTPLIDVMLVLIVMLIITIPMQLNTVNLDMPSEQVSTVVPEVIVVQMDAAGFLRWGSEGVPDIATLTTKVSTVAALPNQPELHLRPSADTPYAYVAAFLAMAQKAGLTKVGVVN